MVFLKYMKFILWTLVWWGLIEIGKWRIYNYAGFAWVDKNPTGVVIGEIISWILYIYLYNHFVK